MRLAETVTFGGSGLDRAAQVRRDPAALDDALARGLVLSLWRGKPLCDGFALVWLPAGHPALAESLTPIFLGFDGDTPRFASDISGWTPDPGSDPVVGGFSDPSVQIHPATGDAAGFVELRGIMARLTPREAELVATAKALLSWHQSHGFCAACGGRPDIMHGGW